MNESSTRAAARSMDARTAFAEHAAWGVLMAAGLLFLIIGGIDIAFAWHPFGFGRADWEFATVTATLNALPAPVIGLVLIAAGSFAQGRHQLLRLLAVALAVLAILILVAGLVYAGDIPTALREVPVTTIARVGLKKSMIRTGVQAILYPVVLFWIAALAWRASTPGPKAST